MLRTAHILQTTKRQPTPSINKSERGSRTAQVLSYDKKACGVGRLSQLYGTCWFNVIMNMFILSDVLLAVVLEKMYELYNRSHTVQIKFGMAIPEYSEYFKAIIGTCFKPDLFKSNDFDIRTYMFAVIHGIYIDKIKI